MENSKFYRPNILFKFNFNMDFDLEHITQRTESGQIGLIYSLRSFKNYFGNRETIENRYF